MLMFLNLKKKLVIFFIALSSILLLLILLSLLNVFVNTNFTEKYNIKIYKFEKFNLLLLL